MTGENMQLADTVASGGRPLGEDGSERSGIRTLPRLEKDAPLNRELVQQRLFGGPQVRIGRFAVLDLLGQGAMGRVYAAYDDRLDRKVAIKVLLEGDDRGADAEAQAHRSGRRTRMEREAQAMAKLSHPNIVQVHEVGIAGDDVYIAMEFVRGRRLDEWIRDCKPSRPEILDVYIKAGRGLEAAHRADIVHRDFKPQNVIVGSEGVVKVLDLGLARMYVPPGGASVRAPGGEPDEPHRGLLSIPLTRTGALVGTPAYMAPELWAGEKASPQSDQYSFCISLLEGLLERHPLATDDDGVPTLAALVDGQVNLSASSQVPTWLKRALLRGLSAHPASRYPSMDALLSALGNDPGKVRRRRLATTALVGVIGAGWGLAARTFMAGPELCRGSDAELAEVWNEARGEAVRTAVMAGGGANAGDTWSRVKVGLDAYAGEWTAMRQEACETHAAGRQSDELFDRRMACLDGRREHLDELVGILAGADAGVVDNAATAVAMLPAISRCDDSEALLASLPPADDPQLEQTVARDRSALARAQAHEDVGQYAESLALVNPVLAGEAAAGYRPLLAEALLQRGSVHMWAGDGDAAHRYFEQALYAALATGHAPVAARAASRDLFVRGELQRQADQALADKPLAEALVEHTGDPLIRGEFLNNLGVVAVAAGDLDRGLTLAREALALKERWLPDGHRELFYTRSNLAAGLLAARRFAEAAGEFERLLADAQRTLGEHHPLTTGIEANLGYALREAGDLRGAFARLEHASKVATAIGMTGQPSPAYFAVELGAAALALREFDRARASFTTAEQLLAANGDELVAVSLHEGLGDLAQIRGDLATARAEHQTSVNLRRKLHRAQHFDVAYGETRFAAMLLRAGAADEALEHLRGALAIQESISPDGLEVAEIFELQGRAQLLRGDVFAATAALTRSLSIREAKAPGSREVARSLLYLGEARLADGPAEALTSLRRAAAILAGVAADSEDRANLQFVLAKALWSVGAVDEATEAAQTAARLWRALGDGFGGEAAAVESWTESLSVVR